MTFDYSLMVRAASESTATSSSATTLIIAALGAGGLGAIIAAMVTGFFSKKKLGAEATEIITKAAAGVVTNLQDENTRVREEMTKLIAEHKREISQLIADHEDEIEEHRRVLQLHVAWDAIAIAEMAKLSIELPPAPPLLPARRFRVD